MTSATAEDYLGANDTLRVAATIVSTQVLANRLRVVVPSARAMVKKLIDIAPAAASSRQPGRDAQDTTQDMTQDPYTTF